MAKQDESDSVVVEVQIARAGELVSVSFTEDNAFGLPPVRVKRGKP